MACCLWALNPTKLISRKIWMAEKYFTVRLLEFTVIPKFYKAKKTQVNICFLNYPFRILSFRQLEVIFLPFSRPKLTTLKFMTSMNFNKTKNQGAEITVLKNPKISLT